VEGARCEQKAQVVVGNSQTCVLLADGNVRCWGSAPFLGYGTADNIGDDETPRSAGNVDVGGRVVELAAGQMATCAILESGGVRCWGQDGVWLGYGNAATGGKPPALAGDLPLGAKAVHIAVTHLRTCVLLEGGGVRCWGEGDYGALGNGTLGFVSTPPSTDVQLGEAARLIAAGRYSTCAIGLSGNLRCWGNVGKVVGDNEHPESAGIIAIGEPVQAVAPGWMHLCALLGSGRARCWGTSETLPSASDRPPGSLLGVDIEIRAITSGDHHTCIVGSAGQVRCWGHPMLGAVLGYPGQAQPAEDPQSIPPTLGDVDVGGPVEKLAVSNTHTCALLSEARIRCWGSNQGGVLGYGHTNDIGDDESPAAAGDVPYL
jgi:alpha-tubulin suppressor-like RCC1 family protein